MRIQVFLGAEHYVQISQLYAVLQRKKRRSTPTSLGKLHLTEAKNGQHFPKVTGGSSWAPAVVGGSGCGSSHWKPGQRMWAGMTEPWTPAGQGVRASGQKASREQARREGVQTSREPSLPLRRLWGVLRNPGGEEGPGSRSRQLGWETATAGHRPAVQEGNAQDLGGEGVCEGEQGQVSQG